MALGEDDNRRRCWGERFCNISDNHDSGIGMLLISDLEALMMVRRDDSDGETDDLW